jgi:hypothetical protein
MPEQKLVEPSVVDSGAKPSRPPVLFRQTQRLVREIEAIIQEPLVTYWNAASRSICNNDVALRLSVSVLALIRRGPTKLS